MSHLKNKMRQNTTPIYFIDWCLFTALGMENEIGTLHLICAIDTFDGLHPNIFTPKSFTYNHSLTCEETLNALLRNEEVIQYIQKHGKGKLLTWLLDETTERLAAELGLEIALPPVAIRHQWDNKANTNRLAELAGVPCVPYVLAFVADYAQLRRVSAHLGTHLVVQMPHGLGGQTTFFISDEADFEKHRSDITSGAEMKIMTRIHCLGASLEACITRHGVVVSPLLVELIGIKEINIYKGGWSGDELYANAFSEPMRLAAQEYAIKMGEQLRKVGYKGYFQPDFLIDTDTNTLYLGEMNLRFSGFTPLINNALMAQREMPLLLLHLAEWLEMEYDLDIKTLNHRWMTPQSIDTLSFLHLKNIYNTLAKPMATGIYRMNSDGKVIWMRSEMNPQSLKADEIFWFSTAGKASKIERGDELGALFIRSRVTTDGKHLTETAKAWVTGLMMNNEL
ncbi:MAG: hypothetical protein RIS64_1072 [Bacteroidota bacterium]|jgi:hypothetical protein